MRPGQPGQILKALRPTEGPGRVTLDALAVGLNERCGPSVNYDRIDVWKMEAGQRPIPPVVLSAWFDVLGVPTVKRWETLAARLGMSVPALLSMLGLPVTAAPEVVPPVEAP